MTKRRWFPVGTHSASLAVSALMVTGLIWFAVADIGNSGFPTFADGRGWAYVVGQYFGYLIAIIVCLLGIWLFNTALFWAALYPVDLFERSREPLSVLHFAIIGALVGVAFTAACFGLIAVLTGPRALIIRPFVMFSVIYLVGGVAAHFARAHRRLTEKDVAHVFGS